jgi:precorrin-2 dehydrogenase/sirohydrochlorin ferrochelatase
MIKLAGRKCVVIGAGKVAAGKVEGLLSAGARVVVIGPKAVRQIRVRAKAGELIWRPRRFSPRDLRGAFLAIAATDSPSTNESVFRSCQAHKVLCNSVDDPEHCDFYYPAVVRRGPLQIAISTSGRSPALAARLRKELSRQFGPEWSALVEQVGRKRQGILKTAPNDQRKRLLRDIAHSGFRPLRGAQSDPIEAQLPQVSLRSKEEKRVSRRRRQYRREDEPTACIAESGRE